MQEIPVGKRARSDRLFGPMWDCLFALRKQAANGQAVVRVVIDVHQLSAALAGDGLRRASVDDPKASAIERLLAGYAAGLGHA